MTQEQLEALCREWQKTLRLQDWDVKVRIVRQRDMDNHNAQGEVDWTLPKKSAAISILDPTDYPPNSWWGQDIERTLVHELLHLHFAPFVEEEDGLKRVAEEQAIDCLAIALVALKRRGQNVAQGEGQEDA